MIRNRSIWLAAGVLASGFVLDSLFVVEETELAVPTLFGRVSGPPLGPGPHFVAPRPFGAVLRLDRRRSLLRTAPTEYLTSDKKNLLLDFAAVTRVADPELYLSRVRDAAAAETRLMDLCISALGAAAGRRPSGTFFSTTPGAVKLDELAEEVRRAVDERARASLGVAVEAAFVTQVHFPWQNREAIVSRMKAERERIARRLRSEGEEAARKIEADSERERRLVLAEASRDADVTRGKGEAEATRLYAEAYRVDPQLYELVRALSAYEKMIGEETTIFLDAEGPVMKPLLGGPAGRGPER